jgi:hypothetical protein
VELAKVMGGWLWHISMIGNKLGLGLGCFGRLVMGHAGRWGILLVVGSLLHGVVDFSGCCLW